VERRVRRTRAARVVRSPEERQVERNRLVARPAARRVDRSLLVVRHRPADRSLLHILRDPVAT